MVHWLRLSVSNAGGMHLIPGWGTKIPHATQHGQKKIMTFHATGSLKADGLLDDIMEILIF